MLICVFASCTEKTENVLICKDSDGKESAGIDRNLLSLIVAVVNYQLGADSLEDDMWDMEYQEGNGTTVKEIVIAQSRAYAEGLLQAEYLCDKVYKIGLSDKQKDSVSSYISSLSAAYGSKKSLETLFRSTVRTQNLSQDTWSLFSSRTPFIRAFTPKTA